MDYGHVVRDVRDLYAQLSGGSWGGCLAEQIADVAENEGAGPRKEVGHPAGDARAIAGSRLKNLYSPGGDLNPGR